MDINQHDVGVTHVSVKFPVSMINQMPITFGYNFFQQGSFADRFTRKPRGRWLFVFMNPCPTCASGCQVNPHKYEMRGRDSSVVVCKNSCQAH